MSVVGLSPLSDQDLRSLIAAIDRGEFADPISVTMLQARGIGHLASAISPYLKLGTASVRALAEVVLAEREARRAPKLSLVWTGDDPGISLARRTKVLLPELFASAREHVLVAGYSIDRGAEVFAALYKTMLENNVTATFFVDVDQLANRLMQHTRSNGLSWSIVGAQVEGAKDAMERGRTVVELFLRQMWPWERPRPIIYFDPRTADRTYAMSLHAKCVVIDHSYSLITSANFTDRGQNRNIEAGVAIEDRSFAASLERQWQNLIDAGLVVAVE